MNYTLTRTAAIAFGAALLVLAAKPASAATLCVNPGGTSGCYKTIGAAVAAASANDTISVAAGVYPEQVTIGKSLSLIGAGRNITTIDATGLANGIYIDGIDNVGLSNVVVRGFTVANANFEGILVTNAWSVNLSTLSVLNNDKGLVVAAELSCPAIPSFETAEGDDCGEGIHLSGVSVSTVANSIVEYNAGGILLSDDTGATHHNVISGNVVMHNWYDCGITLASHPPAAVAGSETPLGVYHNTVVNNTASFNGTVAPGAGAGVGIFDSVPGTKNYDNVVINNQLRGNGMPGFAMHSHTPGQILTGNQIIGNHLSGNGPDFFDAATPGTTGINIFGVSPVTGTIVSQNVIRGQAIAVAIKAPSQVDVHLNDFRGSGIGVDNLGSVPVNATENWWGCMGGAGATGCTTASGPVMFTPWLTTVFVPHGSLPFPF